MSKTMQAMQAEVHEWASQFKKPYFDPEWMLASMVEEVGEVARELNHQYGDKKKKATEAENHLSDELADLLFSIICLANSEKIDLSIAYEKMMDKILKRDQNRFEKK